MAISPDWDAARAALEPLAEHMKPGEVACAYSAAISLKRLADTAERIANALDGTTLGVDITESLAGLALARNR